MSYNNIDTPHFDFPFQLSSAGAKVVEQDTIDDIADCVVVTLLTHVGWRDEVPSFGVPDFAMRKQPLNADNIDQILSSQEPRALFIVNEQMDQVDHLIDRVNVGLSIVQKGSA